MSPKKDEKGEDAPLPPITAPDVDLDETPGAAGSGIPPLDFQPDPDDDVLSSGSMDGRHGIGRYPKHVKQGTGRL